MDSRELALEFKARRGKLWTQISRETLAGWVFGDVETSEPLDAFPVSSTLLQRARREAEVPSPDDPQRLLAMALAGKFIRSTVPLASQTAGKHWVLTVRQRRDSRIARLTVGQCEALIVQWSLDWIAVWMRVADSPLRMAPQPEAFTAQRLAERGIEQVADAHRPFAHDASGYWSLDFEGARWLMSQPAFITAARLMNARLVPGPFAFASSHDPDIVAEAWAASEVMLVENAGPIGDHSTATGFDRPYAGRSRLGDYPEHQAVGGELHERAVGEHHRLCEMIVGRIGERLIGEGLDGVAVDLAWLDPDGRQIIAEVKSCFGVDDTHQLRLGLGQLLEYRQRLACRRIVATSLLVVSHVGDREWYAICAAVGVQLVAVDNPEDFKIFTADPRGAARAKSASLFQAAGPSVERAYPDGALAVISD